MCCEAILTEALTIARQISASAILAYGVNQLGIAYRMHGRFPHAWQYLQEAVDLAMAASDRIMSYRYRSDLAEVLRSRGDLLPARRLLTALVSELAENGDAMALWETHLRRAMIDITEGALAASEPHLAIAVQIISEMGIRYGHVSLWC